MKTETENTKKSKNCIEVGIDELKFVEKAAGETFQKDITSIRNQVRIDNTVGMIIRFRSVRRAEKVYAKALRLAADHYKGSEVGIQYGARE